MNRPLNILIVEDNNDFRDTLIETLTQSGFHAHGVGSAEELFEDATLTRTDLLILDINLPGENGLDLARRLRALHPGIGILMLSARQQLADRCVGYEAGADIYLTKPVSLEELNAALLAIGRRLQPTPETTIALHRSTNSLHLRGEVLQLSAAEVAVLGALALAPDTSLEYWQLLQLLGKAEDAHGKAQLEVLISRLRAKLEAHGIRPRPLRALRGKGYQLSMEITIL